MGVVRDRNRTQRLCPVMIHPLTLKEANRLVRMWHRHHRPTQGGLFAIGIAVNGDSPCGAVIVGRPLARRLDDGWTCEVTRCVTDGTRNACSMLYRAAWRTARAMGYRKLITYTLAKEGGASLRGAGFECAGEAGGGNWNVASRPRVDTDHQQKKIRWELKDFAEPT